MAITDRGSGGIVPNASMGAMLTGVLIVTGAEDSGLYSPFPLFPALGIRPVIIPRRTSIRDGSRRKPLRKLYIVADLVAGDWLARGRGPRGGDQPRRLAVGLR